MRVISFLIEKFETVEALCVIDILRRAGIEVVTVSVTEKNDVVSAQNISVKADCLMSQYAYRDSDVLFLPGGPGTKNYENCQQLIDLLKEHNEKEGMIAAICAAPSILGHIGILEDKKAICFPGYEKDLYGADVQKAPVRVVRDGNIVTSRGMGTATDLGLELVGILCGVDKAEELGKAIQYVD